MAKETSIILRTCDWIVKYSIYTVIFLMPILFLPWTADVLDFNKQTMLILLSFIALFAWMLKVLISGKFKVNISKIHIVVGVLFLVYLLATIFSVNRYGSFWGWPQSSSESLLSLIGLVIFYFLVSNTFTKKDILNGVIVFFISAAIAEFIGVLQLFGLFIVPFAFAKSISFNTIGSAGSLGFFTAILLPLTIAMLIVSKKWWKILFVLQLILSALILFLVGYPIIWWVVIFGSAFVMIFGIIKRNIFDGRWMALPMFFLAISLFFVLLNPQFPGISQRANEIFLSQKASLSISFQAIKERPIFGSGPGTFYYDFLKFKDPSLSQSSIWNVTFNQASSKVLNDLASIGVLGLIALLAFMVFPIFYGIKFIIFKKTSNVDVSEKETEAGYTLLTLGILTALATYILVYFLYNSNLALSFLNFLMLAGLVGLIASEKKEYELRSSSLLTLIVTFVFTLVYIFGLGIVILDGQRYIAEISYLKGLASWQAGNKDVGTRNLESAASLNSSSDLYFRQLSQVYILLLQDELQNTKATLSDEEKAKIQTLMANSVNAAKVATDLNPKSSGAWANRGYVYQSLHGLMGDSLTWALTSYEEALKLDPNNPYLFSQEGIVNFILAQSLAQDKADQKSQLLNLAKDKLERAVALNPNYSNALYSLGLVYDALGQKEKAIEQFKKVQQLNPDDENVQQILKNLSSGLPALQGATLPVETPPSDNSDAIENPPEAEKSDSSKTTPKTK